MSLFTVIGGRGFIGSRLVDHLRVAGHECQVPDRGHWPATPGHVIYAAGLTGDFRQKPFETVQAHVCDLAGLLHRGHVDSFLYLSSTRVYAGQPQTLEESAVSVTPLDPDHLYNLSKLMGESICLSVGGPAARVARLSNVYGPELTSPMFLDHIVRDSVDLGRITLESDPDSAKDYIHVDDAVRLLAMISANGQHRIYNVASGVNVSNRAIASRLQELTRCQLEFRPSGDSPSYAPINIDRMQREFSMQPRLLLDELPRLVETYSQSRRAA